MKLRFKHERDTKNKHVFEEVPENGGAKVESLYVIKDALKKEGYEDGDELEVEITVKKA